MKKLCYVSTVPAAVHAFLRGHIQTAAKKYQVTVVCSPDDKHLLEGLDARLIFLPIKRKPSPLRDLQVLLQLFTLFRRERFDVVHSINPKTGMLAMMAAWMAHVPVRIHTFTGQVWATRQGVGRTLLKGFDKLIARLATCVLADSPSQRDFLVKERVLLAGKARVIGLGSICGVDAKRFHADVAVRRRIRDELGISQHAIVILFVGRLNRDKGVLDLVNAFDAIAQKNPAVELLLVGAEEDVSIALIKRISQGVFERLHYVPFTTAPQHYMMAADIFCLPSYREGFPMTVVEAAACEVPAVATRIYGTTDTIVDGETGLLFPAGDVSALIKALSAMIEDEGRRKQMGEAACVRVQASFSSEMVTGETVELYGQLYQAKPITLT